MTTGRCIRRRRKAKRWSLRRLAQQMRRVAAKRHDVAPSEDSLRQMISRWEHDRIAPSEYNRRLLAEALDVKVADLGLTEDPDFPW
ncbi:hypothetical protein GCM10010166_62600 [Couchioplanes caeruleus subsp. azureus]|nr:hypothetical protein GCM10010166_62600 [Couchioplanes caeruleus subsp. azureus]